VDGGDFERLHPGYTSNDRVQFCPGKRGGHCQLGHSPGMRIEYVGPLLRDFLAGADIGQRKVVANGLYDQSNIECGGHDEDWGWDSEKAEKSVAREWTTFK
jgi:hypothetical protein